MLVPFCFNFEIPTIASLALSILFSISVSSASYSED
jgi:hypothetical protein